MKSDRSASERERLRARIRDVGLRCTAARLAVLGVLSRAARPMSHADCAAKLASAGLDRTTVYRNLVELSDAELVARVDLGDHVWRFEIRGEVAKRADKHAHFICVDCGEITCLPDMGVQLNRQKKDSPRAVISDVTEVLLKGHCHNCA
jgi:Fur family ferric uptake transcriptional regulator